jgi:hypothetical protein
MIRQGNCAESMESVYAVNVNVMKIILAISVRARLIGKPIIHYVCFMNLALSAFCRGSWDRNAKIQNYCNIALRRRALNISMNMWMICQVSSIE